MDLSRVYTKTSKGILEGNARSRDLTREHGRVLALIDGKSTVSDLLEKNSRLSENRLAEILDQLTDFGMIRQQSGALAVDDLGFSSTIIVGESNTQAFVEAQVHLERELRRAEDRDARTRAQDHATLLNEVKADIEAEAEAIKRELTERDARELQANTQAEAKAQIDLVEVEKQSRRASDAQAQADAKAHRAREDAAAHVKAVAEHARKQLETEVRAREEAEARAKVLEAEVFARAEAARKAKQEAIQRGQAAADAKAQMEAEKKARLLAEKQALAAEKAREEAERKARKDAENSARLAKVAEAQASEHRAQEAKIHAEQEAQRRADMEARMREIEKGKRQTEEAARELAKALDEARIAAELETRVKRRVEARAREEEEMHLRAEEEARVKLAEASRLREEAEARAREEAEARRLAEAAKLKAEQDARAQLEAERLARQEAEARALVESAAQREAEAALRAAEQRAEEEREARAQAEEEARKHALAERQRIEAAEMLVAEQARQAAERQAEVAREAIAIAAAHAKAEEDAQRHAEEQRVRAAAEALVVAEAEEAVRLETEAIKRQLEAQQREEEAARRDEMERAANEAAEAASRALAEAHERAEAEAHAREEARQRAREATNAAARAEAEDALRRLEEAAQREEAEEARMRAAAQTRALAAAHGEAVFPFGTARKPPRRIRFDKTLIKPTLYVATTLFALALVALHLISFDFYIPRLERQLTESLGQRVAVKALRFSIYPAPHLKLEGVAIGDLADARVGTARLYPTLSSWFAEQKVMQRAELEAVSLSEESVDALLVWSEYQTKVVPLRFEQVLVKDAKLANRLLDLFAFNADIKMDHGRFAQAQIKSTDQRITIDLTSQANALAIQLTANRSVLPMEPHLQFDELKMTAIARPGSLTISHIEAQLYGGSLIGNGQVDWRNGWVFTTDLGVRQVAIQSALALFTQNVKASGVLEAKIRLTAKSPALETLMKAPQAQITFRARDGELTGVDLVRAIQSTRSSGNIGGKTYFNELSGYLQLANGRYQYRQLKLLTGMMSAYGNLELSTGHNLSGNLVGELRTRATVLRTPFLLSGTLDTPMLKVDRPVQRAAPVKDIQETQ